MYLSKMKASIVEGLQNTFATNYPNQDFQNVHVSIEYPIAAQQYPSVWVTYDDRDALQIASIAHREQASDTDLREVTRWLFAGSVTLTAVALSSLERDNLYDELVRIFAFSRLDGTPSPLRDSLDVNDFIAVNVNWDEARPGGDGVSAGTPWGTEDELIYEKSLTFDVEGEFVSTPTGELVNLSAVIITGTDSDAPADVISGTVTEAQAQNWMQQWH